MTDTLHRVEFIIDETQAGRTVEQALRGGFDVARHTVRHARLSEDGIWADGVPVRSDARVVAGQVISLRVGDEARTSIVTPEPGPLNIAYEDEDFLVVNKPPFMVVHPGPGHKNDTLGNYVNYHYDQIGLYNTDFHPTHRLDRDTSGLILIAKHATAQAVISKQMHTNKFFRTYSAICQGTPSPPEGTIDEPLGRVPGALMTRHVTPEGQRAVSHYKVLATNGKHSLISVLLETGRTHQIRVHFAHIGHPLVGDTFYGAQPSSEINRPALHSAHLEFSQPFTEARVILDASLPSDMTCITDRMNIESII